MMKAKWSLYSGSALFAKSSFSTCSFEEGGRGERKSGGRATGSELYFVRNIFGRCGSGRGVFLKFLPSPLFGRNWERRVVIVAVGWGLLCCCDWEEGMWCEVVMVRNFRIAVGGVLRLRRVRFFDLYIDPDVDFYFHI